MLNSWKELFTGFLTRLDQRARQNRRRTRLLLENLEARENPSTLIPVPGRRDLVFDGLRDILYMTTANGDVARYDVANQALLSPLHVGSSLNGADITPDDGYLYVTEGVRGPTQGFVHKVNLDDGTVTDLRYNLGGGEGGSWDIAVGGYGKAVVTTTFEGSGWTDLKEIDLSTDTFTPRRSVRQSTVINRGADRSLIFGQEWNISSGPTFVYDAGSGTFPASADTGAFIAGEQAAVNRDGSLIAVPFAGGISILDQNLKAVEVLPRLDGAVAFDPTQDVLYAVTDTGTQVVAFDTTTWTEKYRVDVGENVGSVGVFGNGVMRVSDDGTELFVSTPSGVRMIDLPQSTGVATRLDVGGFPSFVSAGTAATFTVTAKDPAGNIATGFTGTVHFSSTDPDALLHQDYTFTADDQGVHTFNAVLETAGTFSITVTDAADDLSGTQLNIQVHTGPVSLIPVANHRKLVYDDSRGILYITTSAGTVERYDVATQSLLTPYQVGSSFYGADITPDGSALFVAEGQRGATQGLIREINLDGGSHTNFGYPAGGTGGAWQVVATNNDKVFFDARFEGSGWVNLTEIDLGTGQMTARRSVRQDTGLYRGANRGLVFGLEANISSGPLFTYDATTDTFPHSADTNTFLDHILAAVNRDDSLIAMQFGGSLAILDSSLGSLRSLPSSSGVIFDPQQDLLYAAVGSQIVAYDTHTWTEQFRLDIGEAVGGGSAFGNGEMAIAGDGSLLFVATGSGVRIINLPGASRPNRAHLGASHSLSPLPGWAVEVNVSAVSMPDLTTPLRFDRGELPVRGPSEGMTGHWSTKAGNDPTVSRPVVRAPRVHPDLGDDLFALGL